jgi:transcriptional regulator with XRE-family HTH domain
MIGERIKSARVALGYSAEQVAEFLGVSPATIYRYENGDISKLPSKFIKPLADFLCVSPSYLMGWSETSDAQPPAKPRTIEAQLLARGVDNMPAEQREQALNIMKTVFLQYKEYFEKGEHDDDNP